MGVLKLTPSGGTPVNYVLVPFRDGSHVRRPRNQDFATPFRQGPQSPQALEAYQSLIFPNFSLGIGRDRIASDSWDKADEYRRFYDATADTRWESGTYGPIQEEDSTETGLEVIRGSAAFKGSLWGLWEDDTSTDIVARVYSGTSWGGGGTVRASASAQVGLDLIAHKDRMIALHAGGQQHRVHHSTDGVTWTAPTTTLQTAGLSSLFSNDVDVNENIDGGLLAEIGGEAVVAAWDEAAGTITFASSSNAGVAWTDESIDIQSGNGPQGIAVMAGIDNEDKLYVGTQLGLYEIDTAPATWTFRLIFPMSPHTSNCRRMTVHNDELWFAQGVENDVPVRVWRMLTSDGRRRFEPVPNDFSRGDAGPAEIGGRCTWMKSADGWLYMTTGGGAASRNARIWCHNNKGWHSMRRHGTATEELLWLDAHKTRLHYGAKTSSATVDTLYLDQFSSDPSSGVSIKREATGYIDLPFVDFGHPHESKNVLRVGINAKDLVDTSNEYINVDYGSASDLGAPTARGSFTNLGDFLPATSRITLANNVGLSARTFALRVNIITDTAGNTTAGVLFDVSIDGYAVLPPTDTFEFQVDLKATDDLLYGARGTTIANLNTARAETLLLALTYADIGTIYVRIPPTPAGLVYSEEIVDTGVGGASTTVDANQRRQGVALVRVVQPIA